MKALASAKDLIIKEAIEAVTEFTGASDTTALEATVEKLKKDLSTLKGRVTKLEK